MYSTRVVGVAEPLLKPDPEFAKSKSAKAGESTEPGEILRETLEEMELIGDLARLPGGYWLPSPLHIVPLKAVAHSLLIGGRPIWALPKEVASRLDYSGVTRFVMGTVEGLPVESEVDENNHFVAGWPISRAATTVSRPHALRGG